MGWALPPHPTRAVAEGSLRGKIPRANSPDEEVPRPRIRYEDLRQRIGYDLARADLFGSGVEALPAALWLFRTASEGYYKRLDEPGIRALRNIRAPEVDKIFIEVLREPHTRYELLEQALREVGRRELSTAHEAVRQLCGHYQKRVRRIARYLAWKLDLGEIPDYAPVDALSGRLEKTLRQFVEMSSPYVPKDKKLALFDLQSPVDANAVRQEDWEDEGEAMMCEGWLLATKDGQLHIRTVAGREITWPEAKAKVTPFTFDSCLKRYAKLRAEFNKSEDVDIKSRIQSSAGIRTFGMSNDQHWEGSVGELLIAAWALEKGKRAIAAEFLLPTLQEASDEAEYFDEHRHRLATVFDRQMLQHFARERDYDKALVLARHLSKDAFKGYSRQHRAIALARQLPKRDKDFKTLRLPTPSEWKKQRAGMDRPAQVRFLAKRIRLLACQQHSQPGAICYSQDQYAEPYNWEAKTPPKEAINPFIELLGMNLNGAERHYLISTSISWAPALFMDTTTLFFPTRPASQVAVS